MNIKRHKGFIKDFRKAKLTDKQFDKFVSYIAILKLGKNLPAQARDHLLEGNYKDCREFHLGGDMLLIYLSRDNETILLRIGTHSQLF